MTHFEDASRRVKSYNDDGIQNLSGGQEIDTNFFGAIQASYTNIVYHPMAMFFLVMAIFILVTEANNTHGPLELIVKELGNIREYLKDTYTDGTYQWLINIINGLIAILSVLIKYKIIIAYLALLIVPYIAKPSNRHLLIFVLLSALLILFPARFSYFEIFIMSQLFYLYAMVRSPAYKAFVVLLSLITFGFGFFQIGKDTDIAKIIGYKNTNSYSLYLNKKRAERPIIQGAPRQDRTPLQETGAEQNSTVAGRRRRNVGL